MTRKTCLIPTEGILTKEGLQPASYNIDSYVSMMEAWRMVLKVLPEWVHQRQTE
ncbi:Uncharacterised protein [Salmonella enterica subsp. arizonae]|uniref:Uncharacterized protein n=1 Tax=Salmonella enterica subsp. arizonae TaxID=59203 RepID=A0A3S4G280_SALER|nr:Uncharacterised protein [Salmonella enterica subsp. arizonae]